MKKFLSLTLIAIIMLCSLGCSSDKEPQITADSTGTLQGESNSAAAEAFSIRLHSAAEEVSAGDSVTVFLNFSNFDKFACADIRLFSSENVSLEEHYSSFNDFESSANIKDNTLLYSCYVARTINIDNSDVYTLTYKVSEDAKAGDEITFSGTVALFQIGTDASGDTVESISDRVSVKSLTLKVK